MNEVNFGVFFKKNNDFFLVKSLVREYVSTLDDGRSNVPIGLVEQGKEPMEFTVYFHGWHYNETAKVFFLIAQENPPIFFGVLP